MTHKCFQCDQRFDSSGQLVKHMQESHSNFVQDAQNKIDRSKEKYSRTFNNTAAACPYCGMDCHTRKKLMRHLETEHKDPEPEEETAELKIIQITNTNKKSLLEQFDGDKAKSSGSSSAATSANSPTFVRNLIRAIESDPAKIASSKIKVSSTSLKLPERRYKCFWCDTSFRKRGKLMDHIDMFHKANKDQSEMEAEILQGVSRDTLTQEVEKPKSTATLRQSSCSSASSSLSSTNSKSSSVKESTKTARSKSCVDKPATQIAPPRPKKKCCVFNMIGSIREESRTTARAETETDNSCKFFLRSCGDVLVRKQPEPELTSPPSPEEDRPMSERCPESPPYSPPHKRQMRSTSISSSSSQLQASPQAHAPPPPAAQFPSFNIREPTFPATAASHTFRHQPSSARNPPLTQSLFPQMPYYMPTSDLYLNPQHNMMVEQQRSQLQYLSYMQTLVSQNTVDPNRPLDLSKTHK